MTPDATPVDVWRLVERADELIKYAGNRDPKEAWAQARATLEEARGMIASLPDRAAAAALSAQIARRSDDIDRLEKEASS